MANQRGTYRFIHDEALNLANKGLTMHELGNASFFPKGLALDASARGYYGTLSHNLRAVYNFYLGYYDGNPASLNKLPPTDSAQRYVAALGGEAATLSIAKKGIRCRRLPLGRRAGQPRRVRQPQQRSSARLAGRCVRAIRLSGGGGHLAQRLLGVSPRTA
jgi:hypothetical protein